MYMFLSINDAYLEGIFLLLFEAINPSLETDETRIGHAVQSKPKAAVLPPTHFLKDIFKLQELLVIFPCLLREGVA